MAFSEAARRGNCFHAFGRLKPFAASIMPAAVQRRAMLASRQRLTLPKTRRMVPHLARCYSASCRAQKSSRSFQSAAGIARAIKGVQAAGKHVIGVRPDGTLVVGDNPVDATSLGFASVQNITVSKWEDQRA
jgi:hypothetical protein